MKQKPLFKTLAFSLLLFTLGTGAAHAAFDGFTDTLREIPGKIQDTVIPRHDFRQLVKNAGPAVVNISTERTTTVRNSPFPFDDDFFRQSPFGDRFPSPFGAPGQERQQKRSSLGSGFIISEDGYIVTNNHVIEEADVVRVNFGDASDKENSYDAEVIGFDKETDLALLKIESKEKLPFIKFGDSDKLEVGEWVLAIGNPFGLDHSVTAGILSAKFRNIDSTSFVRFLQTDASINPGNSGGPLLNMDGEVIGINTAISAQGQGIGFAIPSSLASKIIEDLKSDQKVSRGWIGVTIQNVDPAMAKALGLPKATGSLIGGIIPGEPADKAGLEAGDVVLKIDDKPIANSDEMRSTIAAHKPGEKVKLTIWRDGKEKTLTLELTERQVDGGQGTTIGKPGDKEAAASLGISVRELTDRELKQLGDDLKDGGLLIVGVDQGKLAAESGLRRGDIIISIDRKPVGNVNDFSKTIRDKSKAKDAIMLQVYRGGQKFVLAIDFGGK